MLPDAKSLSKKRKREFDTDCAKVQSDKVFRTPFFNKLSDSGKPLADLVFIEIFSGTGGLCAEVIVRGTGLPHPPPRILWESARGGLCGFLHFSLFVSLLLPLVSISNCIATLAKL